MSEDERDKEDAERRRMLVMIGAGILIVIIGGWLVFAIRDYLAHERCVAEGHRYCDGPPIEISR
ncbi:MAG TPA: hypothetical protein VIM56_16130 [Rhizomicrobium sp.]